MIEYLKNGLYLLGALVGTALFALIFFGIIDIAVWIGNKLGDLIFGKGK